mgnify:CR=1 FL=1|tara:strand:+ start:427 stop:1176 length:750 start_codon:yes stop_codon:yes gene_type:complete
MIQSEELLRVLIYIEEKLDQGELEEAESLCQQMIELYPKNAELLFVYAITLQLLEKRTQALSLFEQLIHNDNTSPEVWNHYAFVLFEEQQYTQSQEALHQALQQEPQNAFSWWILSLIRTFSGNFQSAKRAYLYARWLDPEMYTKFNLLTKKQTESLLQQSITLLPAEQQYYWNSVIWNITDIPDPTHLRYQNLSPLKPLLFFESSTATLHIYRYNIAYLKLNKETVQQIIHEELTLLNHHRSWPNFDA